MEKFQQPYWKGDFDCVCLKSKKESQVMNKNKVKQKTTPQVKFIARTHTHTNLRILLERGRAHSFWAFDWPHLLQNEGQRGITNYFHGTNIVMFYSGPRGPARQAKKDGSPGTKQ